jgi:hypothetical protein
MLPVAPRVILVVLAVSAGGFMLLDGSRNLATGTYFGGGTLGPWSRLVSSAGFDPHHFGLAFVLLGLGWLVALAGLLGRRRWAWWTGLAVAVLSLWYLPVGAALALVWIALLVWRRRDLAPTDAVRRA